MGVEKKGFKGPRDQGVEVSKFKIFSRIWINFFILHSTFLISDHCYFELFSSLHGIHHTWLSTDLVLVSITFSPQLAQVKLL